MRISFCLVVGLVFMASAMLMQHTLAAVENLRVFHLALAGLSLGAIGADLLLGSLKKRKEGGA